MPHPQLLQRVDERGPRQHGEVGQAPPRGVARQQLRDAAVAAGRLEQRGQVDAGQDEVELRAGVASRQDLEDAGALAGEAAADAGEGLGGGQGDSAVPRDRRGGSVEAMIEGTPESIEALISWARVGPAAATVERVDITQTEGSFSGFELRPTE